MKKKENTNKIAVQLNEYKGHSCMCLWVQERLIVLLLATSVLDTQQSTTYID